MAAGQSIDERAGFLWWRDATFARVVNEPLLATWRDLGVAEPVLRRARTLLGKKYATEAAYSEALDAAMTPEETNKLRAAVRAKDHVPLHHGVADGPVRGYSARGWLGQYLTVVPERRLVAVRMRAWEPADKDDGAQNGYTDFADDVARLFP